MQPTRSVRPFEVVSEYVPSGDQPQAIAELAHRINAGESDVVLLGATGTGKSATTAWLIEQVQRLLGEGAWVIMFPEGTRIPRGEKGAYMSSGARLAIDCGAPVIPIAVTSARCWPRKAFIKRPGVVDISIGPPIATAGRKAHEVTREVEAWIETEMRRLDPEAYPTPETPRSTVRPSE